MAEAVHPTIDIFCGDGWRRYTVTVEFSDMMAKKDILARTSSKNLEGEKLVDAMLENSRGKILGLQRRRHGMWHMGPKGEPSHCDFGTTHVRIQRHYDGAFHDGPRGEPALQTICAITGTLLEFTHYNADTPCNGPEDSPHYIAFFSNGKPREIKYVNRLGKLHDTPDGKPGHAWLDIDGNVVTAWKQWHGRDVRELTESEKRSYAKRLRLEDTFRRKKTLRECGLSLDDKKNPPQHG